MNGSTQHVLRNQSLSISVGPTLIGIDWLVIYMVCKAKFFTVAAEAIALAHTLKLLHELDRESKVVNNVFSEKFGVSGPLETWIYVGWAAWNDWVHLFFSVFSSTWTWGDNDWMYILGGAGELSSLQSRDCFKAATDRLQACCFLPKMSHFDHRYAYDKFQWIICVIASVWHIQNFTSNIR